MLKGSCLFWGVRGAILVGDVGIMGGTGDCVITG